MNTINKATGWVLVLTLISSCTVFRQKSHHHSSASESVMLQTARLDSMYGDIKQQRIRLRHENRQEWTEILPVGTFSYRPDSGFSGMAVAVRVYRNQSAQQWTKDSSAIRKGSHHRDTSRREVLRSTVQENAVAIRKSRPVSQRWLLIAVSAVILLLICFRILRGKTK